MFENIPPKTPSSLSLNDPYSEKASVLQAIVVNGPTSLGLNPKMQARTRK